MWYERREEWRGFRYPGEGAVLYHPYEGGLHALSETAAALLDFLSQGRQAFPTLLDLLERRFSRQEAPAAEELRIMLDDLCDVGVLRRWPSENESPKSIPGT